MTNLTTLLNQISGSWVLDSVLDVKTCLPRPDNKTNPCLKRNVKFNTLAQFLTNFHCVDSYDDGSSICASMILPEIKELHISFDELEKTVIMMVVTDDTIYIFHTEVDVSGMKVAEIDDAITKIQKEANSL